jgi:phosphoribosyl-dephospho-CoA transferase
MEVRVHDLLRLRDPKDLVTDGSTPDWVWTSLERAPWVVVRRAICNGPLVPVGVRGFTRGQRFAASLPISQIVDHVSPEQLADRAGWKPKASLEKIRAFQVMDELSSLYDHYELKWGPAGSVGFELASLSPTVSPTSDLDLIIRTHRPLDPELARNLHRLHGQMAIRVDVLLETPFGAVALAEYAQRVASDSVLLRTYVGPKLVQDPWSP